MYKVYIVDDESKAVDNLRFLIESELPEVTQIESHTNPLKAIQEIHNFKPDLLFLDIKMPFLDGFGFLEALGEYTFDVIFTTAYEQYAIDAIRKSALDYLLKPIDTNDLIKAFERFKKNKSSSAIAKNDVPKHYVPSVDHLSIPVLDGVHFVKFEDIVLLEADVNYTIICLNEKKSVISSKTLKVYDALLASKGFFRVHHSHLINLKLVSSLLKSEVLCLADGSQVPVSRRKKSELKSLLGLE